MKDLTQPEKYLSRRGWSRSFRFYLVSDGFQDQFGGKQDKKYMIKRMKQLLLTIQDKSMQEQHHTLNQEFIDWMNVGGTEQVDDVCIVGVKLK